MLELTLIDHTHGFKSLVRMRTDATFLVAGNKLLRRAVVDDYGAKSMRLTEAGKVFFTEIRAVLQRADEAAASFLSPLDSYAFTPFPGVFLP